MKKKIIIFLFIIIVLSFISVKDDSVRIRVIASSNSSKDQKVKFEVRDVLMQELSKMLKNSTTSNETSKIIKKNLPNISLKVGNILEKYNESYKINYGMNYFPEKMYNNVKYSSGNYESLVVTIGEGNGDNWWCFLFPPFCLLEAEETENNQIQYRFYLKEIINKVFK